MMFILSFLEHDSLYPSKSFRKTNLLFAHSFIPDKRKRMHPVPGARTNAAQQLRLQLHPTGRRMSIVRRRCFRWD